MFRKFLKWTLMPTLAIALAVGADQTTADAQQFGLSIGGGRGLSIYSGGGSYRSGYGGYGGYRSSYGGYGGYGGYHGGYVPNYRGYYSSGYRGGYGRGYRSGYGAPIGANYHNGHIDTHHVQPHGNHVDVITRHHH